MAGAVTVVEFNLEDCRITLAAVQEVTWTEEGSVKSEKYTVFYSGGEKHERRVKFIVNNKYFPYVKKLDHIETDYVISKLSVNI